MVLGGKKSVLASDSLPQLQRQEVQRVLLQRVKIMSFLRRMQNEKLFFLFSKTLEGKAFKRTIF